MSTFFCGRKPENTKKLFLFCYTITGHEHTGTRQQKSHQIIVPQARAQGINELN